MCFEANASNNLSRTLLDVQNASNIIPSKEMQISKKFTDAINTQKDGEVVDYDEFIDFFIRTFSFGKDANGLTAKNWAGNMIAKGYNIV